MSNQSTHQQASTPQQWAELPPCLACGSCCFSRLEQFVRVSGDDYQRLGDDAARLVSFHGNRAYMRMTDGHCAALLLDAATGHMVCSTYGTRPDVCRELERASSACTAERLAKAERPLLALRRARPRPGESGP